MKTPEQFLTDAARKLADADRAELRQELSTFVDYWGIDAYTPPSHVEAHVREIVKAFVTAAEIIAKPST